MVCIAGQGLRQQWRWRNVVCTAGIIFIPREHLQICHPLLAVVLCSQTLVLSPPLDCFSWKPVVKRCQPGEGSQWFSAGFVLKGGVHHCHPTLVPAPCSFTATWRIHRGSSWFSYVINFPLCLFIYWEMNCINRIVSCRFHFIFLCSFQFLFISIIIRAHGPFNSTRFMI